MRQVSYWSTGDAILYREVWQGKVWTARPVTVVQDRPTLIVLYLSAGTHWKKPVPIEGTGDLLAALLSGSWRLVDAVWLWDSLVLACPGKAHAVHVMRGEGRGSREFVGWYVNLQEPLRRTRLGFDFMDQELDVVIDPDMSRWAWKDEDAFQRAQEAGRFSEEQARRIRSEGERVIRRLSARGFPFDQGWESWYPPAEWRVPALPEGWAEPQAKRSASVTL